MLTERSHKTFCIKFWPNSAIWQFNSVCNKCSPTSKAEKVQLPNLRSHFWSSNGNQVISGKTPTFQCKEIWKEDCTYGLYLRKKHFWIQGNMKRGLYLWCRLTWKVQEERKDNSRHRWRPHLSDTFRQTSHPRWNKGINRNLEKVNPVPIVKQKVWYPNHSGIDSYAFHPAILGAVPC